MKTKLLGLLLLAGTSLFAGPHVFVGVGIGGGYYPGYYAPPPPVVAYAPPIYARPAYTLAVAPMLEIWTFMVPCRSFLASLPRPCAVTSAQ